MYTKESLLSKKYTWGNIVNVSEIGNYLIVEYKSIVSDNYPNAGEYEEESTFHPYVNGRDTNCSFGSLDNALIHAVSCNAGKSRASEFIIDMLKP